MPGKTGSLTLKETLKCKQTAYQALLGHLSLHGRWLSFLARWMQLSLARLQSRVWALGAGVCGDWACVSRVCITMVTQINIKMLINYGFDGDSTWSKKLTLELRLDIKPACKPQKSQNANGGCAVTLHQARYEIDFFAFSQYLCCASATKAVMSAKGTQRILPSDVWFAHWRARGHLPCILCANERKRAK